MTLRLPRAARSAASLIEVGQVGAAEPRGLLGEHLEIDVGRERLVARVDLEDLLAAARCRAGRRTTWRSNRPGRSSAGSSTSGRLVAAITMTLSVGLEAVHLDEELVERLLALVVAAAEAGAALAADGVDLVDEDDAGRVLLGLVEEVADAARADADEHLDEIGAADAEERHARLAGDRLARAASCRYRAGRPGGRPWECERRAAANLSGYLRNSTISLSSCLASSTPATSTNVIAGLSPASSRARLRPNERAWLFPLWV